MNIKLVIIAVIAIITTSVGSAYGIENYESSECFETLHSANLGLLDRQINDACDDLMETGKTFIEGFKDRGLQIYWVNLGDTVSIQLSHL